MTSALSQQILVSADGRLRSSLTIDDDNYKTYHRSIYTLNETDLLTIFPHRKDRHEHLRMHGIHVPNPKSHQHYVRQYVIGVFQCKAIFTYVSAERTTWLAQGKLQTPLQFKRITSQTRTRESKRMEQLAIRSVYALGLDFGVVRLGSAPQGKCIVFDVNARPKLNPTMLRAFETAIASYKKQLEHLFPDDSKFLLGADPEVILVDNNGKLKYASNYFGRGGIVGCDEIWSGNNRSLKPIMEIRPRPRKTPRELLIELYRCMVYATKKIADPNIKWLAGASPHPKFPIGGHIHFSGIPLTTHFLRVLDNYMALPLVLIEDKRGIRRRPKYGYLGDFRVQSYGGFEYRTPPSWLVSPTITKGIFSLANVIARVYPYLSYFPLNDVAIQRAYYKGDKDVIREWVPRLWNDLSQFASYTEEQSVLEPYFKLITSGVTWNERTDIRPKWRLPPFHRKNPD